MLKVADSARRERDDGLNRNLRTKGEEAAHFYQAYSMLKIS
jgi:hypothetical protein